MPKLFEKIFYLFIFTTMGGGVYLSRKDLAFFEGFYVREDGVVEWLTVIALMGCSSISFYRAKILRPFRGRLFSVCLFAMAFIFLFGVGEEISWGQRIFGWKSPNMFVNMNSQQETNFHNLTFGGFKLNKIVFGTLLGIVIASYLLIVPMLYSKVEKIKELFDRFAVPIPRVHHTLAYLIYVGLVTWLTMGGKKGELLEFGGCWFFLMIVIYPLNREIFSRVAHRE